MDTTNTLGPEAEPKVVVTPQEAVVEPTSPAPVNPPPPHAGPHPPYRGPAPAAPAGKKSRFWGGCCGCGCLMILFVMLSIGSSLLTIYVLRDSVDFDALLDPYGIDARKLGLED